MTVTSFSHVSDFFFIFDCNVLVTKNLYNRFLKQICYHRLCSYSCFVFSGAMSLATKPYNRFLYELFAVGGLIGRMLFVVKFDLVLSLCLLLVCSYA